MVRIRLSTLRMSKYLFLCISVEVTDGSHSMLINGDIEMIIQRGEERTTELNAKYEGLNFEDLSNFKSEASVQQWEGEDFRPGVRAISLIPL